MSTLEAHQNGKITIEKKKRERNRQITKRGRPRQDQTCKDLMLRMNELADSQKRLAASVQSIADAVHSISFQILPRQALQEGQCPMTGTTEITNPHNVGLHSLSQSLHENQPTEPVGLFDIHNSWLQYINFEEDPTISPITPQSVNNSQAQASQEICNNCLLSLEDGVSMNMDCIAGMGIAYYSEFTSG